MICPYLSGIDLEGNLVKQDCLKHECAKYIQVAGTDPQTGQPVDEWQCSDAWLPVLLIEGAQMTRRTNASVQSFRNEVVSAVQEAAGRLTEVKKSKPVIEAQTE